MAKISFFLQKTDAVNGQSPIYLRLSDRGKRTAFNTGFYGAEDNFDSKSGRFNQGRGIKSFDIVYKGNLCEQKTYTNATANTELSKLETRAKEILNEYDKTGKNWSFEQFRTDFHSKPNRNLFFSYAKTVVSKYRDEGHYQLANILEDTLRSFELYDSNLSKRMFQDINQDYIDKYISFCKNTRHNGKNTINIRLSSIRKVLNLAIRNGICSGDSYPFSRQNGDGKVAISATEYNKTDSFLPVESLKVFANHEFKTFTQQRTQHIFLFSYYARGCNWRDMAEFTTANIKATPNGKVIEYTRAKTKRTFQITITEPIQREIDWFKTNSVLYDKHLLPIITHEIADGDKLNDFLKQSRKRFNRHLQEMTKELELPEDQQNATIYTARHSFAMFLKTSGMTIDFIRDALNHKSTETTRHYLQKFDADEIAKIDLDLTI